ncbi:MAG: hemerythrin domain-containing protein [Prolixibacteraceae bacterium]|nr:hemerythrin domain-containing protein [Prolixibacteraceae bacterium]
MKTIRMFSAPHKALRKTMSEFLVLAGQTNFKNEEAVKKLKKTGNEMFFLLSSHAETEDKIILSALEAKLPGASEHDKLDHIKIEQLQYELEIHLDRLNTSVSEPEAHDFYLAFASFFSLYLEHIEEEETVTQKLIWENFSADEQLAMRMSIFAKMKSEDYLTWLKHIIPAQNETENVPMLQAIRLNMPAEKFDSVIDMLRTEMAPDAFENLNKKLATVAQEY